MPVSRREAENELKVRFDNIAQERRGVWATYV